MNLNKSIVKACAEEVMTKTELAAAIGIDQSQLSKICTRNSCQTATLEKIVDFFGYSMSEFIALGEDKKEVA